MSSYGVDGIVRMMSHFSFIYFTYWALQSIRVEQIFRKNAVRQIRIVLLFVAIAIGYLTSTFFIEILTIFRNLTQQFLLS